MRGWRELRKGCPEQLGLNGGLEAELQLARRGGSVPGRRRYPWMTPSEMSARVGLAGLTIRRAKESDFVKILRMA